VERGREEECCVAKWRGNAMVEIEWGRRGRQRVVSEEGRESRRESRRGRRKRKESPMLIQRILPTTTHEHAY
jgi:hypothetical protein